MRWKAVSVTVSVCQLTVVIPEWPQGPGIDPRDQVLGSPFKAPRPYHEEVSRCRPSDVFETSQRASGGTEAGGGVSAQVEAMRLWPPWAQRAS